MMAPALWYAVWGQVTPIPRTGGSDDDSMKRSRVLVIDD